MNNNIPQFDDANIRFFSGTINAGMSYTLDPVLNSIDDVRYDLNGTT
jgi:hypothetical protein